MAKKRKMKAIPKRIAGIKVPKKVRSGLATLVASQNGKVVATEALLALGAALASQTGKHSPTRRLLRDHPPSELAAAGRDAIDGIKSGSSALAYAIGEATRTFSDALERGKTMADAKAAWQTDEPEAENGPKKKLRDTELPRPPAH